MAISVTDLNDLKRAPQLEGMLPAILERWSPRSFASREVSTEDLKRVFEAARWAPSSGNAQPWRYIVGLKGSATHEKIAASLVAFKEWAPKAPVLILERPNRWMTAAGRMHIRSTTWARQPSVSRCRLRRLGWRRTRWGDSTRMRHEKRWGFRRITCSGR